MQKIEQKETSTNKSYYVEKPAIVETNNRGYLPHRASGCCVGIYTFFGTNKESKEKMVGPKMIELIP
jgi:hypothetical protein